ncbi:MAG: DUF4836 family protein, partial [Bacteroidota bacterium]
MNRFHFIGLLVLLHFLSACQKEANVATLDLLSHLPASSSVVASFQLDQFIGKPDFKSNQKSDCFQEMIAKYQDLNPVLASILDQAPNSGLYLDGTGYFVYDVSAENINQSFTALVFPVQDQKAFEQLVEKAKFGKVIIDANYQYAIRSNTVVAWNGLMAVLGGLSYKGAIQTKLTPLFNPAGPSTLAEHPDLKKCFSQNATIKIWMNTDQLSKSQEVKSILGLAGFDPDLLKDNYLHHYINFEQGRITGKSNFYLQEALAKDFNLFFKDQMKADFSQRIPSDQDLLLGVSLDINGIKTFINSKVQLSMVTNFALKEYGLSLDDLPKVFGGDLVLSYGLFDNRPSAMFSGSIADEATFQVMVDAMLSKGLLQKGDKKWYELTPRSLSKLFRSFNLNLPIDKGGLLIQDDYFLIASNDLLLKEMEDGTFQSLVEAIQYQNIAGQLFGA